jgi:hypothetical protein
MYKYFTKNNTYRYLDVVDKLLKGYDSVHPAIGMPPSKVSASNIYSVWRKVNSLGAKVPHGRVNFQVGVFLRITEEKVKYEQTFSKEIFRIV